MSDLRAIAHLEEQLGPARWQALINSANTGKVKEFCDRELNVLPTEMTIGGVAYDILGFLQGDEESVEGNIMVARAKKMGAHQGKEELEHILKHQDEIPAVFCGKVTFVFTDDHRADIPEDIFCITSVDGCWTLSWRSLSDDFGDDCRVLRRKQPQP